MTDKIERAARDLYQNIPDEPGVEPTTRDWGGLTDGEREHWRDHVRNILLFFPDRLDGLYETSDD